MADLIAQVLTQFNVVDDTGLKNLEVVKLPDIPGEDPDELREYIVVVKRGYTIDQLEHDLRRDTAEDDGVDSSMVPDRPVSVANPRMASKRQTHFMMTWAEAQALKAVALAQAGMAAMTREATAADVGRGQFEVPAASALLPGGDDTWRNGGASPSPTEAALLGEHATLCGNDADEAQPMVSASAGGGAC